MDREGYFFLIYDLVKEIPPGKVSTYGQLAWRSGFPGRARMVGQAMRFCPGFLGVPCHRVVNSRGRTVPGWPQQKELLLAEGVIFRENGLADLGKCLWMKEETPP